jgi:hypothetical protein
VLWREEEAKTRPDRVADVEWAVPVAYANRAACLAVIDANVKTLEGVERERLEKWLLGQAHSDDRQSVERSPSGTAAEFRTRFKNSDGWIATRLRCLPDTVDPRGPKGK